MSAAAWAQIGRALCALVSALALIPSPPPAAAQSQAAAASMTFQLHPLSSSNQTPMIEVAVGGGKPVPVLLDTGSSGLRVYANAVGPNIVDTGQHRSADFGGPNGRRLSGDIVRGDVRIGGFDVGAMTFMRVDRVACRNGPGQCDIPGASIAEAEAHHRYGVLGLRPSRVGPGQIAAPLYAFPGNLASGYIVSLADAAHMTLTLGLTPADEAGFVWYDIGTTQSAGGARTWRTSVLPVCFSLSGSPVVHQCGPTLFDTGGQSMSLLLAANQAAAVAPGNAIAPGRTLHAQLGDALDWTLVTGTRPRRDLVRIRPAGTWSNSGLTVFLAYDLAFDVKGGRLGFRRHALR